MNIGERGLSLIKEFESLRLVAYMPTPDDVPTIGWGHTKGVKMGDQCTPEQAELWLLEDLSATETCVNKRITGISITQEQYDAVISWVFNVGCRAFNESTLLRYLLDGNDESAAQEFRRWVKQGHKTLTGLVRRRAAEEALFRS